MKFRSEGLVILLALALLAACGDGDGPGELDSPFVMEGSVSGFVQKGPFVKGAHIALQELDSASLVATGREFESEIENDRGGYSVEFTGLASPYVLLRAKGSYRNEVSGEKTELPFELLALTDVSGRETANVNLLTHLEYKRVRYLVQNEGMTLRKAKQKAERELLASFAIALDYGLAEDLDILQAGEGNASLLAVSVLMQMNLGADEFAERVSKYVADTEEDGVWDDARTGTRIADWAAERSLSGNFATIREMMESWGLEGDIPKFEKYVDNFWWTIYGLGECNSNRENEKLQNKNALSLKYEKTFRCNDGAWRIVEEPEGDGNDGGTEGDGNDGDEIDADTTGSGNKLYGEECTEFGQIVGGSSYKERAYFCYGDKWKKFYGTGEQTYGKLEDERDGQIYRTIQIGEQVWMAENLNYNVGYNFVPGDPEDTFGGYYRWEDLENACPAGWHVPRKEEWETLYAYAKRNPLSLQSPRFAQWSFSFDLYGFSVVPAGFLLDNSLEDEEYRYAAFWTSSYKEESSEKQAYAFVLKELEATFEIGLNGYVRMPVRCIEGAYSDLDSALLDRDILVDARDGREYKIVKIGTQTWMAKNLDYRDSVTTPALKGNRWCFDDEPEKCEIYGSIYSCEMSKQICPAGWHLPTREEWFEMVDFITNAGEEPETALRSTSGWLRNLNGTDAFGFNALPGGYRNDNGYYSGLAETAWFWYDGECKNQFAEGIVIEIGYSVSSTNTFADKTQYYVRGVKN